MAVQETTSFEINDALDISAGGTVPHIEAGPLLKWLQQLPGAAPGSDLLGELKSIGQDAGLRRLDEANVRGRAGGGFPVALKWWQLSQAGEGPKYFICNAHASQSGFSKERYLFGLNPYALVKSVLAGAYLSGADEAFLCVSAHFPQRDIAAVESVIQQFTNAGINDGLRTAGGPLPVSIKKLPAVYIAGEETALIEALEGKAPQPRRKPTLPAANGFRNRPTVVSNLESVLQATFALETGPIAYRRLGAEAAPGTLLFTVTGDVNRPGLYEMPMGVNLRELVFQCARGSAGPLGIKMVFPGGLCSAPLLPCQMDVALDFDSLKEVGLDLGSGMVVVISESRPLLSIATQLADFYRDASCGKCLPCKDGTDRASLMFRRLANLDQTGIDWEHRVLPVSNRATLPPILNSIPAGISYTDDLRGLDKIAGICEFFKHRGDCHFSVEAATALQTLLHLFRDEFEALRG